MNAIWILQHNDNTNRYKYILHSGSHTEYNVETESYGNRLHATYVRLEANVSIHSKVYSVLLESLFWLDAHLGVFKDDDGDDGGGGGDGVET